MKVKKGYLVYRGFLKGRVLYLSSVLIPLSFVFPALGQVTKDPCPQIDQDATAAEHAVCWFQLEKSDSPECEAQNDQSNPCIARTNAWCADASLDAEPVATACLLAAIRAGRLAEAKEIAGYLRSPSKTAEACMSVLKRASVRIVTNPGGAEVIVNGRSYGNAPIEVRLLGDWWESDIKARFATDPERIEIAVSSDELLNTFDKEECVFGDLVITGPKLEPPKSQQADQDANSMSVALKAERLSIDQNDSEWLLWTSISLAVAGVASGVAATVYYLDGESDLEALRQECPPPGCYKGDIDANSMETKYDIGNVFAVTGSVCLAAALTAGFFYLAGNSDEEQEAKTQISIIFSELIVGRKF